MKWRVKWLILVLELQTWIICTKCKKLPCRINNWTSLEGGHHLHITFKRWFISSSNLQENQKRYWLLISYLMLCDKELGNFFCRIEREKGEERKRYRYKRQQNDWSKANHTSKASPFLDRALGFKYFFQTLQHTTFCLWNISVIN